MWTRLAPCCRKSRHLLRLRLQQSQQQCKLSAAPIRFSSTVLPAQDHENVDSSEFEHLGQSPQLRSLLAGPSKRADVVVKRPTSFKKAGLARDLLKHLEDFPHALLLCRVGQFYESYFDQAIEVADLLKIRLTSKSMEGTRYPMCGFPIAQLDKFLEKLVRENNRFVAICEEQKHYDDSGLLKFITRKVVRVVTPGTLVDETFIEKSQHNYLLAANMPDPDSDQVELAWMDTSTGELFTQASTLLKRGFQEDVARISPSEVIVPHFLAEERHQSHPLLQALRDLDNPPVISQPRQVTPACEPVPLDVRNSPQTAFSAIPLLSTYINETLLEQRPDLTHPLRVSVNNNMRVDRVSLRALEVLQNNDGGVSGTLLSVVDRTVTSAGRRLLSDRLASPSKSVPEIESRLSLVSTFKGNKRLRDELVDLLKQLDDEARLLQKMSIGRPTPEDLLVMARAIRTQGQIKALLEKTVSSFPRTANVLHKSDFTVMAGLAADMRNFDHLADKIEASVDSKALEAQRTRDFAAELAASQVTSEDVEQAEDEGIDVWNIPLEVVHGKRDKPKLLKVDDLVLERSGLKEGVPPISWGKGENSVLNPSSSKIIERLFKSMANVETRAKRTYSNLVKQMQASPGELLFRVMPRFGPVVRIGWKRTHPPAMREALKALDENGTLSLVNKTKVARYYTLQSWTKHNSEMQGLFNQLREAEGVAVRDLCNQLLSFWYELRTNARVTAELDVACGMARAAEEGNYVRPAVSEQVLIDIDGGRHPVAEHELRKKGTLFIPNDTKLDKDGLLHIVTGPNMGGKSTVLRQVGLICILAQAGSFVPATSAHIGIVDQLFARIRYSDNIARGRSSFRVEMDDAAYILENANAESLVLLDEFGRGTTADYAACIAESTIHALANEVRARSLFATHLHDVHDIIQDQNGANGAKPIKFFCTRLSVDGSSSVQYLYELVPGINRDAEAFTVWQYFTFFFEPSDTFLSMAGCEPGRLPDSPSEPGAGDL